MLLYRINCILSSAFRLIFCQFAVFCLLGWSSTLAKIYVMFNPDGSQTPEYNQNIIDLKSMQGNFPSSVLLKFSDRKVKVVDYLGNGQLTAVFKTASGQALRIPMQNGHYYNRPYVHFMNTFFDASRMLAPSGAQVSVNFAKSKPPEYIFVEYYPVRFTAQDFFIYHSEVRSALNMEEITQLENAFVDFAEKLYEYSELWDFKEAQIASDGKTWKLLDNGGIPVMAGSVKDKTPFDTMLMARSDLRYQIIQRIQTIRDKNGLPSRSCRNVVY